MVACPQKCAPLLNCNWMAASQIALLQQNYLLYPSLWNSQSFWVLNSLLMLSKKCNVLDRMRNFRGHTPVSHPELCYQPRMLKRRLSSSSSSNYSTNSIHRGRINSQPSMLQFWTPPRDQCSQEQAPRSGLATPSTSLLNHPHCLRSKVQHVCAWIPSLIISTSCSKPQLHSNEKCIINWPPYT